MGWASLPVGGADETTVAEAPGVEVAGSIAGGGATATGAGAGIGVTGAGGGGAAAGGAVVACDSFSIRSLESFAYCVLG